MTTLVGDFRSVVYRPGFCHGTVTVRLDRPLLGGISTEGDVTFEYGGSYRRGERVEVNVWATRTGDVVRIELRGIVLLPRLCGLKFGAGTVSDDGALTFEYHLAMPSDSGVVTVQTPASGHIANAALTSAIDV